MIEKSERQNLSQPKLRIVNLPDFWVELDEEATELLSGGATFTTSAVVKEDTDYSDIDVICWNWPDGEDVCLDLKK